MMCRPYTVAICTERDPGRRGRSHNGVWVLAFDSFND